MLNSISFLDNSILIHDLIATYEHNEHDYSFCTMQRKDINNDYRVSMK